MEDLLRAVSEKRTSVDDALKELERRLYGELECNIDTGREYRTGVPEVIIADGKTQGQLFEISSEFLRRTQRAIVSRLGRSACDELLCSLKEGFPDLTNTYDDRAGFLTARTASSILHPTGGRVGLLSAGTSDIPVSLEAELTAREMGCATMAFHDVGVAGVHRLLGPLHQLREWGADVIIVSAGREGALPTLVSGLVKVPVIGLPVSTGYGLHGKGETALFAMLQSCSPLAVVNIDAGFVAGAMAGKIANTSHSKARP
ncbi:MAG: nickel pincer cofactor biosynthesis protein LarB [Candidatus Thermoplasmatota archaeon]|jgi:hypothetical protein|nr:nickel pincer cofactor biosynthesis protein LarB [Candidatus Thermoplasmatota archaeon]